MCSVVFAIFRTKEQIFYNIIQVCVVICNSFSDFSRSASLHCLLGYGFDFKSISSKPSKDDSAINTAVAVITDKHCNRCETLS